MCNVLPGFLHIPVWTDEDGHLCNIPGLSRSTPVSLSDLCWAIRGSHASPHLPEPEDRKRCLGQKYRHCFCLADVCAKFCFCIFVQRQHTRSTLLAAVCRWLNCYILLLALCAPCSCSPWAEWSVWKQEEGRQSEEEGICHHCDYSRCHVCEIYRDGDLHGIAYFAGVGIH